MNEYIFGTDIAGMQSPPARYAYLSQAVIDIATSSQNKPLKILEIGPWVGASTITIGTTLKKRFPSLSWELHVVDPWQEYFHDPEKEYLNTPINLDRHYYSINELARTGRAFQIFVSNIRKAEIEPNIVIHKGSSLDILPQLPQESFDLIYIDGNHLHEFVKSDISYSKQLVSCNGIICGDDLECSQPPVDQKRHEELLAQSIDYDCSAICYHPAVTQAVMEELGILEPMEGFWAVKNTETRYGKFQNINYAFNPKLIPSYLPLRNEFFLLGSKNGYNIFLIDCGIIQVNQKLGQINFVDNIAKLLNQEDSGIELIASREEFLTCDIFNLVTSQSVNDMIQLIAEDYQGFNILTIGNKFYGIPQTEGKFSLERVEKEDYSILFTADDEVTLHALLQQNPYQKIQLISEGYQGFNLLAVGNKFYGILQTEEEFSLERVKKKDYSVLFTANDELALRKEIMKYNNRQGRSHPSLRKLFQKTISRIVSLFSDR